MICIPGVPWQDKQASVSSTGTSGAASVVSAVAGHVSRAAMITAISPAKQRKKITRFMNRIPFAPVAQKLREMMTLGRFEDLLLVMLDSSLRGSYR